MSIVGNSFTSGTAGPHFDVSVGAAGALYTGPFTVAVLMKTSSDSTGYFTGWSGGLGGTELGGMLLANNGKLYGKSDFSSGFPLTAERWDNSVWYWLCITRTSVAIDPTPPYQMHVADLATLTWRHGTADPSGNHPDESVADLFSLGFNVFPLGNNATHLAAGAVWTSDLSSNATNNAGVEAALTKQASVLAAANPAAGWLMPAATSGSPIQDFTGGGANETARYFIQTSPDPVDFDFTLASPIPKGLFLPFF